MQHFSIQFFFLKQNLFIKSKKRNRKQYLTVTKGFKLLIVSLLLYLVCCFEQIKK